MVAMSNVASAQGTREVTIQFKANWRAQSQESHRAGDAPGHAVVQFC